VHGGPDLEEVEEHDVVGALQQAASGEVVADQQELPARRLERRQPGELPDLPQPGELARPAHEEGGEPAAHRSHAPGAPRQRGDHLFGPPRGLLEPPVGCLLGVHHPQVVGDRGEKGRRVVRPAGHADVDLGGRAHAVPVEEAGHPTRNSS
jgi:hypothetical protein